MKDLLAPVRIIKTLNSIIKKTLAGNNIPSFLKYTKNMVDMAAKIATSLCPYLSCVNGLIAPQLNEPENKLAASRIIMYILKASVVHMHTFIICTILAVDGLMSIFESAKKHYQEDRKLYISFKLALKENLKKLVISNSFIALVGFICIFVPTLPIQAFGWVALVMPLVAMFCQLVLMRLFIKMYLALNSLDGKKCNFQKGGKNAK